MCNTYYIGWDVGAWNCPQKKFAVQSQDCITVLYENKEGELILIWAWMGNVSSQICAPTCDSLFNFINGLTRDKSDNNDNIITKKDNKDNFSLNEDDKIIVAIDASLGLPQNAVSIANLEDKGYPTEIDQFRTNNPMLYRYTEQWIDQYVFKEGNLPLSAIQGQIGSQATKALYALKKMGFGWDSDKYIWTAEEGKYTAIETYPTACRKCINQADKITNIKITNIWSSIHKYILKLANKTNRRLSPASKNNTEPEKAESKTYIKRFSDLYDSILCALTAKAFNSSGDLVNNPERKDMGISKADKTRITNEGWIWIPWTQENKQMK